MKTANDKIISIANIFATKKAVENIYIHLPFCKKKCHFCAFPVHAIGQHSEPQLLDQYIDALKQEIRLSRPYISISNQMKSLYFGGGTPSLHSHSHFLNIINQFSINADTEVTAEVNPTEMNSIQSLLNVGIKRISLGVQSFNTSILQAIGRHAPNNSLSFVMEALQKCRPANLNVDFILNFCTDDSDWKEMIFFIQKILPEHLTIYVLQINEGSKLYSQPQLLSQLPNEQKVIERYIQLCSILKTLGYEHYEVSNFSRETKYRSRHSSTYWQGDKQYLAYGMGATSLTSSQRITRPRTLAKYYKYLDLLATGGVPSEYLEISDQATIKDRLCAIILSGIRTKQGIKWSKLYEVDQTGVLVGKIKKRLLQINEERPDLINIHNVRQKTQLLSPYGFLVGDEIGYRLIESIQEANE